MANPKPLTYQEKIHLLEHADRKVKSINFGAYGELAAQLLMIPEVKRSIHRHVIALNNRIAGVKLRMANIENEVLREVQKETITDMKPPPTGAGLPTKVTKEKYTSDKKREAEQFRRLKNHNEYNEEKIELEKKMSKLKDAQGEMDFVNDLFMRNKYLIRLLEVDKDGRI